jgi:uncharacterized protein YpmS
MSSENNNFHPFQSFHTTRKSRFARYMASVIAVFFILATIISATAVTEDFSAVSQQKTLTVCGCSVRSNTIHVQNTGQATSVYELSQEGAAAPWSSLSETRFSLKPGEKKDLHHFIRAPCTVQGDQPLIIQVTTLFDTKKQLDLDVRVPQCNNIVVLPAQRTRVACPSQPVLYEFTLANPLSYPEVYEISVAPGKTSLANSNAEQLAKSVSISEQVTVLGPQQKKKLLVFVQTPSNVYGDAMLNLNIQTRYSGMQTTVPFTYFINQCYDFRLTIPSQVKFCTDFENRLPLHIENTAALPNTYSVEAGILSADSIEETYDLGDYSMPGRVQQSIATDLLVETEPGNYILGVDAQTAVGTIQKYAEAALEITYCDDKGNPLSVEQYEELQRLLKQQEQEPEATPEEGTEEGTEELAEGEEGDEPSLLPLFLIILALVMGMVILGLFVTLKKPTGPGTDAAIAQREEKRKLREARKAARLESSLATKKKPKALLIALLTILFIVILLVGVFVAVKLGPDNADAESKDADAGEEAEEGEDTGEDAETETIEEGERDGEEDDSKTSSWLGPLILIAILIVALALILLAVMVHKKQKKQAEKAGPVKPTKKVKETSDEPLIGLTKSVKELTLAKPVGKKVLKGILAIVILLLLIGGFVALGIALTSDRNQVVFIDTERATALGLDSDNKQWVEIPAGTEVTIPLVFKHPGDEFDRFVNLDFGIPWIETKEDKVTITPGDDTHADLKVTKDAVPGKYNIVLEVKNDRDELFALDNLHIDIVEEGKSKVWKWVLAGLAAFILIALVVLLVIVMRKKRKKGKAAKVDTKADKKAAKKVTDEQIRVKEERKARRKKRFKQGALLLGLLIVVGLITWGVFSLSRTYMIKTAPTQHEPVEIVTEEAHDYILNVTGLTQVPIKITNNNRKSTYHITVLDTEEWITFDTDEISVEPLDHETINMMIEPHKGASDGTHRLGVKIEEQGAEEGEGELFNSHLVVIMNKRGTVSKVLAYWIYILLGVVILTVILVLIRLEAKKAHKADLQDLAKEARDKVSPNARKKSKYRMKRTRLKL